MRSKARNFLVVGIAIIVFLRPLVSGLTYPWSNTYIQSMILILSLIWFLYGYWNNKPFFRTHLDIPILTFFLLLTVSTLKSVNSAVSLNFVYQFMSYVLLFFLVTNNLRNQKDRSIVIFALFLSTAIVSLYGIYQYFEGLDKTRAMIERYYSNQYSPEFMGRLSTEKAFSTFVFPPALAGFLILVMPLSISMCLTKLSGRKWIYYLLSVLIFFCLILTFSKGGWIAGLFSMMLFIFIWLTVIKGVKKNLVAIAAAIPVLIFTLLIVSDCLPKVNLSEFVGSFHVRLGYWKSVPSMVKDFFFLGSGPGTFGTIYPAHRLLHGRETQMAHNNFLQILVETGVAGFLAFIWLWIKFFGRGISLIMGSFSATPFAEKEDRMLILGCFAGITGFLLHSFVDFGLYIPGITMTAFLFLGLIGTSADPKGNLTPFQFSHKKGMKLFLTVIVLAAGVYMMWAVRMPMLGERCFDKAIDYAKKGKADKSISLLKEAVGYCPRNAKYHFQLGIMYEGKGSLYLNKAIRACEIAVTHNPYMPAYHCKLSWLYWSRSRGRDKKLMEKAISEMQGAVFCYPVMPKYHMQLGRLYHLTGMFESAKKEYNLTLECKDAIYRGSEKAKLQEMLERVEQWLSELK